MGEFQPTHLLLVLFVALLLFGGSRVSALGRGLGEGIRNFKKGLRDDAPDSSDEQIDHGMIDSIRSRAKVRADRAPGA